MATTDTSVSELIINKLTKTQYDNIQNPSDTELYIVPDEVDSVPTSGSDNYVTSGGVYTALQDKANKSEMSVVDGTGNDADKTTITLKTGTAATVLKTHQNISGKQDVINSNNKLSADYIQDGTTNKVINVKPDWNAASGSDAEILNKPTIPSVPVTDVTVDGTSVVSNGTAAIPYIPDPPGFLKTNNATAQTVVDNESMAGNIKLHKIAKTGTYSDLIGTPSIPDAVSGTNDGTNWTTITIGSTTKAIPSGGGGLTNYDFTHTANTTISTSTTTITFAANQRGSQMITVSADIGITFDVRNLSDNYLWIKNTGSSEIDVTISSVVNDQTAVSNVYVPTDGISVPAGGICEIGIVRNADGAFITSRNDLEL